MQLGHNSHLLFSRWHYSLVWSTSRVPFEEVLSLDQETCGSFLKLSIFLCLHTFRFSQRCQEIRQVLPFLRVFIKKRPSIPWVDGHWTEMESS